MGVALVGLVLAIVGGALVVLDRVAPPPLVLAHDANYPRACDAGVGRDRVDALALFVQLDDRGVTHLPFGLKVLEQLGDAIAALLEPCSLG